MHPEKRWRIWRSRALTLISAAGATAVLLIAFASVVYYGWPDSSLGKRFSRLMPFPVVVMGTDGVITSRALDANVAAMRRFYENQDFGKAGMRVDFTTEDGKLRLKLREKDLLNKMIEDIAIEAIASEHGIRVSPQEARTGIEQKLAELGTGSQVEQNLARLYGWTLSDFGEKVVLPSLYEEKVQAMFDADSERDRNARETIERAQQEIAQGKDFSTVAREFSEGQTSADGGELGWFVTADLAPELRVPVEKARRAVPTDIVESELGFHILLVEESKLENGQRLYHLRQIFTRKTTFADWLSERMRSMSVRVFSRDYEWKVDEARVDFRRAALQNAEKKLMENATNDPSLVPR